jgi:hypothetical protein
MLVVALALSSCGGQSSDLRVLSEAGYLAVLKRSCLAAKRVAGPADRASVAPVVFLRRAAGAAESIQREFADVRPPARFAAAHREMLGLGEEQLGLIRTALARWQSGAAPETIAALEARNRRLLERSDELAGELGLPECVGEPVGT